MRSLSVEVKKAFGKVDFTKDTKNHLMLEIKGGPAVELRQRPPLEIIAVVDVSSSMDTSMKMQNVQKSLRLMVENMSPEDFLTVIEYDSDVRTTLQRAQTDSRSKQRIFHAIGQMRPDGMTNFSGALLAALEQARNSGRAAGAIKRIIFFTDGCPTSGVTDPIRLVKYSARVPADWALTTMGYGAAADESRNGDFILRTLGMGGEINLDLLEKMADAGRGNFYYMRDADSAARAFAAELGGLMSTVAQDVRITVESDPALIELTEALEDLDVEDAGDSLVIRLPDLMADETKFITLAIVCRKQSAPDGDGARPVAKIAVQYLDVSTGRVETLALSPVIQWVEPGREDAEADKDVATQLAFIEAIHAQEEAYRLAAAGDFESASHVMRSAASGLRKNRTVRGFVLADCYDDVSVTVECEDFFDEGKEVYAASLREAKKGRASGGAFTPVFSTASQKATQDAFTAGWEGDDEDDSSTDNGQSDASDTGKRDRSKKSRLLRH
jgi:Mg-chelatase subunit ChlD